MRISTILLAGTLTLTMAGCAGPEQKMGRGLNNLTEFTRLGDIRRSMEQTALWDGPSAGYTTGFLRGFNRSLARTGIGIYEVVTAPIPPYGPVLSDTEGLYPDPSIKTRNYPWGGLALPERPVFPASYEPGFISGSLFNTDTYLGFSGGDVAPMVPGSRFHIFDN
jgi:putative exosortase-associated protein (TIGR04073 family)